MREQLIQYVQLLFAGAADCDDTRQEILQNTLDRYDDLIAAGKTPEVRGNAHIQAKKSGFSGLTGHVTMIVMMEQHDHLPRIPPGGGPRKERDTSAPFRRGGFCKEVPSVGTRTARRTAR